MFELIGFIAIQVFLLAGATILGSACVVFVFLFTRAVRVRRLKLIALGTAFLFPFFSIFYLEVGLLAREALREFRGQDNVLGGFYHFPLGNGYTLEFFDENGPEDGAVISPRREPLDVERIYGLQIIGDSVFVQATPSEPRGGIPTVTVTQGELPPAELLSKNQKPKTVYLELNTKTSERTDYRTLEELQAAAGNKNASLKLVPIEHFYREAFSAAGASWTFLGVLIAPVVLAAVVLLRKLRDLRALGIS